MSIPATVSLAHIVASLKPDEHLYLSGASAEPIAFVDALTADRGRTRAMTITNSYVPGINPYDPDRFDPTTQHAGMFMQPSLRVAEAAGRYRHLPLSYAGMVRLMRERLRIDTVVVQVAPPDADGMCSLGLTVELALSAMRCAKRAIGLINYAMPRVPGSARVHVSDFALLCEAEFAPRSYVTGEPDQSAIAIASHIAPFVADGAALQIGLGKVPGAFLRAVADRKGLRLQSGMLSDGVIELVENAALDPDYVHTTTTMVGEPRLYEWMRDRPGLRVAGCEITHDAAALVSVPGLIAVNSALEVDLFGQCNLEYGAGRAISGAGGSPEFGHAAARAPGGVSIVALPAAFGKARTSRIVGRIGEPGMVTLPRTDVDVVVTEHGAADLRGRSMQERAAALIGIAEPTARAALAAEWSARGA